MRGQKEKKKGTFLERRRPVRLITSGGGKIVEREGEGVEFQVWKRVTNKKRKRGSRFQGGGVSEKATSDQGKFEVCRFRLKCGKSFRRKDGSNHPGPGEKKKKRKVCKAEKE